MVTPVKKVSLISTIQRIVTVILLLLAFLTLSLSAYTKNKEADERAEQMRRDFVADQRKLIKFEVDRVVKLIDYEVNKHRNRAKEISRLRTLEAHSIASNIYQQNKGLKSDKDIQKIIIDALRPVRFDSGDGYYFIISHDGYPQLAADSPEIENTPMLTKTDTRGNHIVKDMLHIGQNNSEGFYTYFWSKPNSEGNDNQKVSYIKQFEPFNWIIGTGTYLSAVEQSMQEIISHYISENRFGPNNRGYVFINELLNIGGGPRFARVYANPNRPNDTGKVISDDFKDANGKMFRKEFLKGLRARGECFVDYWYRKIDNPQPSPKTSYFKLTGDGRFIVAAGLYTDDIEETISILQSQLRERLVRGLFVVSLAFFLMYLLTLFIFNRLSNRLESDFQHFVTFFQKAAQSSELIEREELRFLEFDQLADYANQMLRGKIEIEKELDQEQKRLLTTLHSIADGVVATDNEGKILLLNRVAAELTGWPQELSQGKKLSDIVDIEDASLSGKAVDSSFTSIQNKQDLILHSRSGRKYRISMSSAPIFTEEAGQLGNVVVLRDETEKHKTELELFKAQKLESVGLLAGGIAHDFNNILSGIYGNIELAQIKAGTENEVIPHLQIALDSLVRAKRLTAQLLTFSKGGEPLVEVVNLKEMVHDVVPFNLSGSSIVAEYDLPEDLWKILADPGQISQVISNLVINAKHAMAHGGTLTVSAANVHSMASNIGVDSVQLEIIDNGSGMSEDILQKVFDPYFTTKRDGSGLGLSMVYSIIEKHGGNIAIQSVPEQGTRTTILLAAREVADSESETSTRFSLPKRDGDSLKILLIEDEAVVRDVLSDILTTSGYQVDTANEGESGVKMYKEAMAGGDPYQLVISDLTIPGGMGGKEAVSKILHHDPEAKVIATSGYAMDPIMAKYEEFGFKGRLAKPFRFEDVLQEVSRVSSS